MTKNRKIIVRSVRIQGHVHSAKGVPCQDYHSHNNRGKNFVAVVSDGAGSAKFGKIGAKIICETMVDMLSNADFKQIKQCVLNAVNSSREKLICHRLNKTKDEKGLSLFAATLVGVVYNSNKGYFFHIGDGAALALRSESVEGFVLSRPENGCFSCETFFYTMNDWKASLRFTHLGKINSLFLMSDGLTNFAFSQDFNKIEEGFILPINDFLSKEKNKTKAVRALANTLNTDQAKRLNSDDKTLVWAKL